MNSMTSFSERHGYKVNRSKLLQFEQMDDRLKDAIWNFLREYYFSQALDERWSRSGMVSAKSISDHNPNEDYA